MIVVTGAGGFIGYNMVRKLNGNNFNDIIVVDKFSDDKHTLNDCRVKGKVDRDDFLNWLDNNAEETEFIIHLGARTDTAEFDKELLWKLNTEYTKEVWKKCVAYQLPLIYASSAATYGLGEEGYEDNESKMHLLKPLNPYGESKLEFDLWTLEQDEKPFFWCGLKFFNVYGSGEENKGRMASVVWHAYNQIRETGKMKLFRSHNPDYKDGEQKRDFVYVGDVVDVIFRLMNHRKNSGVYNLGSGKARTFLDLVKAVFSSLDVEEAISFIDTPEDIRDKYQYFTEADMSKLKGIGHERPFTELEEGVREYIKQLKEP